MKALIVEHMKDGPVHGISRQCYTVKQMQIQSKTFVGCICGGGRGHHLGGDVYRVTVA